jgi:tRNA A-37 threonylcarbamoyl transferase component Bud32
VPTTERKIGRYLLIEAVGRGAMGTVYRAEDPVINRTVAVKVLHTKHGLNPQQVEIARSRFQREGQTAASIDHPNIIRVYDVGEDEESGELYIVMEFVAGPNLEKVLFDEELDAAKAVSLIGQIAAGLDAAHARGIIHRDVKPSNILLADDGTVKIADFGLTHVATSALTQDMRELGTPAYMSPEQINGRPLDTRADLFSLGVLSYEILAGRRPFEGADVVSLAHAVAYSIPPPISEANPTLPAALDPVMERMLAKNPSERYGSGREFLAELLPHLQNEQTPQATPPAAQVKPRRMPGWWLAAAAALVLAIVGLWSRGKSKAEPAAGATPVVTNGAAARSAPPRAPRLNEKPVKPPAAKKTAPLPSPKPASPKPALEKPAAPPPAAVAKPSPPPPPVEPRPAPRSAAAATAAPARGAANVTIRFAHRMRHGKLVVLLDGKPIFDEQFSKSKFVITQTTVWDPLKAPAGVHSITARVQGDDGKSYASEALAVDWAQGQDVELKIGLKGEALTFKKRAD